MVKQLEDINMHLMVSVWSKFDYKTKAGGFGENDFWQQMNSSGFVIGGSQYYDPYNPAARELFYSFSKKAMFDIGVDALWLDATEPEGLPNVNNVCTSVTRADHFPAVFDCPD
jgi:alpha-D-xyloside xylohydrolase